MPFTLPFPRTLQRSNRARVRLVALLACAAALAGVAQPMDAQSPTGGQQTLHATRSQLESLATVAERGASTQRNKRERQRSQDEAARLRERLRAGDLQAGDQIVLEVRGEPTLSDTFTVRAGRQLVLPNIEPIPLEGVLRAELSDYITRALSRYLRDPVVRANALIRVSVGGQVQRPGFYAVRSDVPLSEVIMLAGGPTVTADLKKVEVRRGDQRISDEEDSDRAIRAGLTLDQLDIRAGDEVVVGQKRQFNWTTTLQITTAVISTVIAVIALSRN